MTSAYTKVNLSIIDQFSKLNRDIIGRDVMPACIATSYPRINNNVYNHEYTRNRHVSEVSSPEPPPLINEYTAQFSQSLVYPENLFEKRLKTSSPSKIKSNKNNGRSENKVNSTKSREKHSESLTQNGRNQINHESARTNTPTTSPAPIKKRILQKNVSENIATNINFKNYQPSPTSIASSPIIDDVKSDRNESIHGDVSSTILQKMYKSFEKNFCGHIAGSNISNNSSPSNCKRGNENKPSKLSQTEETSEKKQLKQTLSEFPLFQASVIANSRSTKLKTSDPTEEKKFPADVNSSINASSNTSCITTDKLKNSQESSRKRKLSADSHTPSVASSYLSNNERLSPSESSKRTRYSSSESNDDQPKSQENPLADFYQQTGSWFPFFNPLFYQQSPLNPFGTPPAGCHFPLSGFSQTRPYFVNGNSYLPNPMLMRDLMGSSGVSNLMPFFANTMPQGTGFSPQQIHALQQLQASLFYQNTPFLPPSSFPNPSTMLPGLQGSLFMPELKHHKANKDHSGKKHADSERTSSPDQKLSNENRNCGRFEMNEKRKRFCPFTGSFVKQKNYFEKLGPAGFLTSNKFSLNKFENESKSGKVFNCPKRNEKSRPHHHHKQRQNHVSQKKKTEKKCKERSKLKEASLVKDRCNGPPSDASLKSPEKITEAARLSLDPSPPSGPCGSEKSPSYKNLTRERRLVANARERTRVHTISSAFDELRAQIPSYSCNQKLSKLAILRIACEYIRTLSVLAGHDETLNLTQGVDRCTRVLQSESRARTRRKNNKVQIEMEMVNYERHKSRDDQESEEGFGCKSIDSYCSPNPIIYSNSNLTQNKDEESQDDDLIENDNELVDVESFDDDKITDCNSGSS